MITQKTPAIILFIFLSLTNFISLGNHVIKIRFYNGDYGNGDYVYLPCQSFNFDAEVVLYNNANQQYETYYPYLRIDSFTNNTTNMFLSTMQVPGYVGVYKVRCTVNPGVGGDITFKYNDIHVGTGYQYITLHVRFGPEVDFSSIPQLYGSNQTGSASVNVMGNYDNIIWQSTGALKINGSNYISGVSTSVNLSTQAWGGLLTVRASSNQCGSGREKTIVIGPPYLTTKQVNYSSPQYPNYINSSAFLQVASDYTATSYNWMIDGGSGNISPNFNSCNAYTNNFMRVRVDASNQYGTGESFTFYLQNSEYLGYSMAYPNPTDDQLNIDFDYNEIGEDLLQSLIIYDDKGIPIKAFNIDEAKRNKYFKSSKLVTFDLKDVKKGTYFLHVQIGHKLTKQQIIVR
ncbi:hypothetical protein GCM10023189_32420 [Nibrella saemangeumensis]|uniref:Secretion system C-terminal sorting domain-containing protein n=1 Tax=Nibrella saemangeumensis TaxID=1084526 RepID=A0ABP8N391_9BACT